MFKFYLDNILVGESPEGWEDLTTTVRFDRELKGLFKTMDVSLTFWADGYDLIKTAFDTYGHCGSMKFEARQKEQPGIYTTAFIGTLFLKDIEFTEGVESNSVKCKITDNGFFARIYNNKSLKAKIYVGSSKNNVSITAAPYYRLQMFTPTTGAYITMPTGAGSERNNTAFKVFDVFKFLIAFMSDGEVDFYSDTFGPGGKYENYLITNEYIIRFCGTAGVTQELFENNFPVINFADFFTEINKQFNIGFVSSFDGSRPYIRIEEWSYLYPETINQTYDNIDIVRTKIAAEYLYGKLSVGSENILATDSSLLTFPGRVRLVGFENQEYYITGECNADTELNLVNSYIIDHNYIEDLVINGSTAAETTDDQNIVLIQAVFDSGDTYQANQSNWITGAATPLFYNEQLNSNNKLSRHLGAIPNSIALQLGIVDNTFAAETGAFPIAPFAQNSRTIAPVPINVETSDPGGNFNPSTYEYLVPNAGTYSFQGYVQTEIVNLFPGNGAPCYATCFVYADRYVGGGFGVGTLTNSQLIASLNPPPGTALTCNSIIDLNGNTTMNLNSGDIIVFRIVTEGYYNSALQVGTTIRARFGSFQCTATADGGGVYKTFDPAKYPVLRSIFKYPLTYIDFKAFIADPRGLISFKTKGNKTKYGWLEDLKMKNFRQEASFTIITTKTLGT